MIQMPSEAAAEAFRMCRDRQCMESRPPAARCNLHVTECFPLQRRLTGRRRQQQGQHSNHSLSSGFWGSKILTCVKGKSPLRPFTSPSHWPLIFILVTFTMSPTYKGRKKETNISITANKEKTIYIKSQILSTQKSRLTSYSSVFGPENQVVQRHEKPPTTQDTCWLAKTHQTASEHRTSTPSSVTNKWTYMDIWLWEHAC